MKNETKCKDQVQNTAAKKKNDKVNNDQTPCNFKHAWNLFLIVGNSILTGIDEKRPSRNNEVVRGDFRGATIDDLKYHLVPLLKKTGTHNTANCNE